VRVTVGFSDDHVLRETLWVIVGQRVYFESMLADSYLQSARVC
jgi:hypothetical protein